jgi:photosystem II stability/assembly factor-like uncharacterized protein
MRALRRRPVAGLFLLILTGRVASAGEGVWTSHGPEPFHGDSAFLAEFVSLAVDAFDSSAVFVASLESGGPLEARSGFVFKSEDRGESWTTLAKAPAATAVTSLASDPGRPGQVYGLVDTGRLYRGVDGGVSWGVLASFVPPTIGLRLDPSHPSTLFVHGSSLWRLDGSGRPRDLKIPRQPVTAFDLDRTGVLYAGTGSGLLTSFDGGTTWDQIDEGNAPECQAVSAVAAASSGGTVLAAYYKLLIPTRPFDGWCAAAFRSPDRGGRWELLKGLPVPVAAFVFDPVEDLTVYASAAGRVFRSLDGGVTWESMSNGLSRYAGALAIDRTGQQLYVATDGGIFDYEVPGPDSRVVRRPATDLPSPRRLDDRH